MASNYWMKLWIEVLDDPKMGRLSDHLWKRFFELCLIAKELNRGGRLPQLSDISWRLRTSTEEIERDLDELARNDLVEHRAEHVLDGHWFITNFAKRQRKMSGAERVRRYRKANPCPELCNESVTNRYTEEEEEEEKEEEHTFSFLSESERQQAKTVISRIHEDLSRFSDHHLSIVCRMITAYGEDHTLSVLKKSYEDWCKQKTQKGNRYDPNNPAWVEKAEDKIYVPVSCANEDGSYDM